MGVMRFLTDPLGIRELGERALQAYVVGYDGRVMPTRAEFQNGQLVCTRSTSDSGKLKIAWPVEGRGVVSLSTASLRERDEPYLLAVELARGAIVELRNQAAMWQLGGMSIPVAYTRAEKEAFQLFAKAACSQSENPLSAAELAQQALTAACRADDELMRAYTLQKLASSGSSGPAVVLGCGATEVPQAAASDSFVTAFSATEVSFRWTAIEADEGQYAWGETDELVRWAEDNGRLIRGGPLLDFRPDGLPQWLGQWSHDLLSVQSFLCDFVETAMARYRGSVKFWEVAVGTCSGGEFGLNEEQRLTLVARVLEAAQKADDDSHTYIRIDNPWGEYQRGGGYRLSPLQFVDALARSNLGLEGVNLEFDLASPQSLTSTRSLSDISRLIDVWTLLGLPIQITLIASSDASLGATETTLTTWLNDYLPMLTAKPSVTGVFWSHWSDATPALVPGSGVLRHDGSPKPIYDIFARHQQAQRIT